MSMYYTVKLANSARPFKFHQVNFKKLVLRMIKCVFHKEKPDPIDTVYEKHIYHSQDQLVVYLILITPGTWKVLTLPPIGVELELN